MIAYTVSRRLPEFGMCLALGAERRDIAKMVLGPGVAAAMAGTAIGAGGALFLTRLVGPQLYDVKPNDPWIFTAVAVLLLAIALVAAWLPARRASARRFRDRPPARIGHGRGDTGTGFEARSHPRGARPSKDRGLQSAYGA